MAREDTHAHARVDVPESHALVARTSCNIVTVGMEINHLSQAFRKVQKNLMCAYVHIAQMTSEYSQRPDLVR